MIKEIIKKIPYILPILRKKFPIIYSRYIGKYFSNQTYPIYADVAVGKYYGKHDFISKQFYVFKNNPVYEEKLLLGINNFLDKNESVTIVGGGFGVTATKISDITNRPLNIYEPSIEQIEIIEKTFKLNGVDTAKITIHNCAVSNNRYSYDGNKNTPAIQPSHIIPCDFLELDCEGAELEILRNLAFRPKKILVETHGFRGSPTSEVIKCLNEMGYSILELGIAEPRLWSDCVKNDIYVLYASLK